MPAYKHSAYGSFQFIGYDISTNVASAPGPKARVITRRQGDQKNYLPVPSTIKDTDAKRRLYQLAGVVDEAANSRHLNRSPSTLKIFMAPELFFRPQAGETSRSYSKETGLDILKALKAMFVHEDFKDWLFLPGSIVYKTKSFTSSSPDILQDVIRNLALLIKGGHSDPPYSIVDKHSFSAFDRVDPSLHLSTTTLGDLLGSYAQRKRTLLQVDGLKLGTEICLDHRAHVLKELINDMAAKEGFRPALDFHLICSCGVQILNTHVGAKEGGYVLRQDGASLGSYRPRSQIGEVTYQDYLDYYWLEEFGALLERKQRKILEVGGELKIRKTETVKNDPTSDPYNFTDILPVASPLRADFSNPTLNARQGLRFSRTISMSG